MPKSAQSQLETETILRWDETGDPATLWTASPSVRREWAGMGYPVEVMGGGWLTRIPADRISYKTLRKA